MTSKVIKAGKVVLIGSFVSRGISALSSIILARLLFENDYGALVIATIFTGLIAQIGGMGYEIYYLQYKGSEEEKAKVLDQVFNLRMATNFIMFVIQAIIGLGLVLLTNDKMSGGIILMMSLSLLLEGFNAPNEVLLRSKMDFKKITIGNILKEFSSTIGKVGGAFLGIGGLCFGLGPVLGSLTRMIYLLRVQKYRPEKFNWDKPVIKGIFNFSKHVLFGSVAMYGVQQIDRILLSIFFPKNVVGQYGFAWGNAAAPFNYLVLPQSQLILTYISTWNAEKRVLYEKLTVIMRLISVTLVPLTVAGLFFTNEVITILFTEKWLNVAQLVRPLLVYYYFLAFNFPFAYLLTGLGYPQLTSRISIYNGISLLVVLFCATYFLKVGILGYTIIFIVTSIGFSFYKMALGVKKLDIPFWMFLKENQGELILGMVILLAYLFPINEMTIISRIFLCLGVFVFYFFTLAFINREKTMSALKLIKK